MLRSRVSRFLLGLGITLVVAIIAFAFVRAQIATWGATAEEVAQVLPGDEMLPNANSAWVNAVTIHAPIEQVWPWIAQLGDLRGSFYSYGFIEKLFTRALLPGEDVSRYYNNINTIHPEWQNPQPGDGMITDVVVVHSAQPGQWLLATATEKMGGLGWTWLWHLTPVDANTTRLVVHLRIQPPATPDAPANPVMDAAVGWVVDLGGFVMEKGMLDGIRLRAEGGSQPDWMESTLIALWLIVLAAALAAGITFVQQMPTAWWALALGLAAEITLFVYTYVQPAFWLRLLLTAALLGVLVLGLRGRRA